MDNKAIKGGEFIIRDVNSKDILKAIQTQSMNGGLTCQRQMKKNLLELIVIIS